MKKLKKLAIVAFIMIIIIALVTFCGWAIWNYPIWTIGGAVLLFCIYLAMLIYDELD